jgi:hypothetical protein
MKRWAYSPNPPLTGGKKILDSRIYMLCCKTILYQEASKNQSVIIIQTSTFYFLQNVPTIATIFCNWSSYCLDPWGSHLRKPSVRFSLTLISPLAEFTATEMPPIGLCDLPFFTDQTLTIFGVTVEISPRKNSAPHEVWIGGLWIVGQTV